MPYSDALISNMALGHISVQGYITDLDADKTNEGRQCKLFYPHARDLILEMMAWPFATKRWQLQEKGTPFEGWSYCYAYPNDCAFASKLIVPGLRTPGKGKKPKFRVVRDPAGGGKLIMSDEYQAVLEGNERVTDPAEFDAMYAQATAMLLATFIAGPLRVEAQISQLAMANYQAWQLEASNKALREEQEDELPDSEFVAGRS